nr:hypothetical protein [Streptomyces sp. AC495_CC817]
MVAVAGGVVAFAGHRVRASVPRHWQRTVGRWSGPNLRWSPARYDYTTPDGVIRSGTARVRVMFRPTYGGSCVVAYDPDEPSRSQPAQLRGNGGVLMAIGLAAMVSGLLLFFASFN